MAGLRGINGEIGVLKQREGLGQGFVKKVISTKNHEERASYGFEHIYDSLFSFFDHNVYIDEAHVDPTSQG